ncbi:MAG: SPOR domain-containing protein, partial [Woeseiaceae bacterium]
FILSVRLWLYSPRRDMIMDRALKERIIGATVLVLFVVLVVPVFLDGPNSNDEVISQNVPLPGQSGDENQTIVLNRDRDQPVPAANNNRPAVTTEKEVATPPAPVRKDPQPAKEQAVENDPEPAAEKPVETKPETAQDTAPAQVEAAPAETSSTGMWAVQLGSFGDQDNADKLAADLRKQNFTAFLSKLSTSSGELHRVRIGPQKDRASAEAVAKQLLKAGHKGQVVPHP